MRKGLWLALVLALAVLLVVPAVASALTYDEAVDQLLAGGYPQGIEEYLTSQGTSDIGMAFGGSSADTARAQYLAKELRKLGLPGEPGAGAARRDGVQGRERHRR